jgi:hypothetical protein
MASRWSRRQLPATSRGSARVSETDIPESRATISAAIKALAVTYKSQMGYHGTDTFALDATFKAYHDVDTFTVTVQ